MDFAIVKTDVLVRMKKQCTAILNTPNVIDGGIHEHVALLNAQPGVAVVASCEGHTESPTREANRPYLMLMVSFQGLPFIKALAPEMIHDILTAPTHLEIVRAVYPWADEDSDPELNPENYYHAWIFRGEIDSNRVVIENTRCEWLAQIREVASQFS